MRGKIIHYNGSEGRGLIAADSRQFPFEIGNWRSDTAPTVNQTVDLVLTGDNVDAVTRVSDEVILKEKAGQLASKLGTAGGAAFQSLKDAAPATTDGSGPNVLKMLGKNLLIAHGVFVASALLLPFLRMESPFGVGGRSFTLTALSEATEMMGASIGGTAWPLLAILSIALPVFWRNRFAWLALLLPLFATIKPGLDLLFAAGKVSKQLGESFEARLQRQIFDQVMDMLHIGMGAWVCLLAGMFIAAIGLKRVLLPPNR